MSKNALLFILTILLIGCDFGLNRKLTQRLDSPVSSESLTLYINSLEGLQTWIERKSVAHDSGHYYIFQNSIFIDLYSNSRHHYEYAMILLADPEIEPSVKKLIIRTMQCLNVEEYLQIGELVQAQNNTELVVTYLSPGPEYGFIIDEYYDDANVKKLLKLIVQNKPELSDTLRLIESGENKKRYHELINFGENLPVLECSQSINI